MQKVKDFFGKIKKEHISDLGRLLFLILLIVFINIYYFKEKEQYQLIFRQGENIFINALPLWLCLLMLFLIALLLLLPFKLEKKVGTVVGVIALFVFPLVMFWLTEGFFQNPFHMEFVTVCFNYLIYLAIYLALFAVIGRYRWAIIGGGTITLLLGLCNYYVKLFRGTPLCPWDVLSVGTAVSVVGEYEIRLNLKLFSAVLCVIAMSIFAFKIKARLEKVWSRCITGAVIAAALGVTAYVFVRTSFLENQGYVVNLWSQSAGYLENGCFLSFVMNMKYMQVEKPEGYSAGRVEELLKNYDENNTVQAVEKKPNIIMIMNEAYADLSVINDFETTREYNPFVDSLQENTVKGNMYVSIFGGGTSNTEYEVLTGNSMTFLAPGSIAYQQYIHKGQETPGLTSALKELGYTCYAMHPMSGNNWNRNNVYESLGFINFFEISYFKEDVELIRNGYVSDWDTYEKIIQLYEEKDADEPLFVMDVTMQNHGGYNTGAVFPEHVYLQDMEGEYPQTEEYLSLIKISDDAFSSLIEYFSQEEEPTMIVMFGDHQPAIEEEFYEELYGKKLEELNLEEIQRRYVVPFIIWTNYDIEEAYVEGISANYLPGQVLKYAGLPVPKYFAFQNELMTKIPVINVNGYVDAQNHYYSLEEENPYEELINQYKILHYNSSMDIRNRWYPMYTYEGE